MNARAQSPRPITIAVVALGGEGGGVLADWIVDLAEPGGYLAQATAVPGVAQRTGATIYYVELFPKAAAQAAGREPVLALMPMPGDVDVVLASELMEAARAVERGFVTPDRTLLVASTHRVFAMTEKIALADGRAGLHRRSPLGRLCRDRAACRLSGCRLRARLPGAPCPLSRDRAATRRPARRDRAAARARDGLRGHSPRRGAQDPVEPLRARARRSADRGRPDYRNRRILSSAHTRDRRYAAGCARTLAPAHALGPRVGRPRHAQGQDRQDHVHRRISAAVRINEAQASAPPLVALRERSGRAGRMARPGGGDGARRLSA